MSTGATFAQADKLFDKKKYKSAFKMFLLLSEAGDTHSMSRLANMYFSGQGVEHDVEKSIVWDIKAAQLGNSVSCLNLGVTFRSIGDIRQSKKWFELALEAGHGEAAIELAKMYLISELEIDRAKTYLNIALSGKSLSEDSRNEATELLDNLTHV